MTGTGTGTMTGTGTGTGTMTGIMNIKKIIFLYQLVLQQVRNNLTIQSKNQNFDYKYFVLKVFTHLIVFC